MQAVIVQVIIMLHAAFGCMFLFMNRRHPARFTRLMAQSWLLEGFRACIVYAELDNTGGFSHWHSLSDCLNVVATWWLLAGCADLAGVKLPPRLGHYCLGIGIPVILALRYVAPALLEVAGYTPQRAEFSSILVELIFIFTAVAVARFAIFWWLLGIWRKTRLPGALLAILFGVPYIVLAVAIPFQFYFGYFPEWIYLTWAGRVLGFSLGLLMLLFDRQLAVQRERERANRRIVETSHDLIWSVDASGRWTSVNQATRSIYGYEPEDILGRPFTDFVAPERVAADRAAFEQIIAGKNLFNFETIHRRKDGTAVNLSFNAVVLSDERGRLLGVTGTAQDITERKKAEQQVRHLANFPELNPNPVLEFAADGAVAYQNPAAHAMVRRLGQHHLEQLLPPEAAAIVRNCLATGQPRLRLVTAHGRNTLSWSFYPIVTQQVVHCYIGDITERTLLEGQLRQSQKMEAVGQLAGGVAHDFNNLLTAIIGHLGLLQSGPALPAEAQDSLTEIGKAAGRATNLTNQLLAFSRLQVSSIRPLDLNEVVTNLGKMLRRLLGEDIAMHLDLAPGQLVFNGDAGMMEQVVLNLVVNARDAMPAGGSLRIATCSERRPGREAPAPAEISSWLCLSVSDTGTGIPPEVLPKIFEPFFTTKEVGKGTGLGLATVFGIVQQHHGWIDVESKPGLGTTFRIFLPQQHGALTDPSGQEAPAPALGHGEVILLVEDEPAVREVGVKVLGRQGYKVLSAENGRMALDLWSVHRSEVALLLTDMVMPGGVSGLELARRLQAEKPSLRVIYTSGYNREIAGDEEAMRQGMNYLAKPYEIDRLFLLVREVLDAPAASAPVRQVGS